LTKIRDPATLRAELASVREQYNSVRLHAGIGYVTPNDEHEGRGGQIRKARQAGLEQARLRRIAYHRANHIPDPTAHPEHDLSEEPAMLANPAGISVAKSETGQPRSPTYRPRFLRS
jgi:hypothetical protein